MPVNNGVVTPVTSFISRAFWLLLIAVPAMISAQRNNYKEERLDGTLIVSPTTPRDSRGEVVYEGRGESQKDFPKVPGVLNLPATVKVKYPKCPKSLKGATIPTEVTVHGVISTKGDLINTDIDDFTKLSPDVVQNTRDVLPSYRFRPATLDGLPIAFKAKVVVVFEPRR